MPSTRRGDCSGASTTAWQSSWQPHVRVEHALQPILRRSRYLSVCTKQVTAAGEILIHCTAGLRGDGDEDAVLASIAAQLRRTFASPPVEPRPPVSCGLLTVESGRRRLEHHAGAQVGRICKDGGGLNVGTQGEAAAREGMCEAGGLGPCREPLILLLNNRALAVAGQESAIACHDLSDEWLAHWILLYKARDRRHAASLRQRQKTRDLRPVQPQNGLWPPSWLDVARDAHLREKDDVCS